MKHHNFDTFPKLDENLVKGMDEVLGHLLPDLMAKFKPRQPAPVDLNPFADALGPSVDWAVPSGDLENYEIIFESLRPIQGKVSGANCKSTLIETGVPSTKLRAVWGLADYDKVPWVIVACVSLEVF